MAATYTLRVVTDFASAHTLRGYPGDCARMHGHNWKVEVEVVAEELDEVGMAVDFKVVKKATKEISSQLDHRYLNDLEMFTKQNPTAENIAAHFYSELSKKLNNRTIRVCAVTLWETDRACARYSKD